MNDFPTTFSPSGTTLQPSDITHAGQSALQRLAEEGYSVQLNITTDDAEKLNDIALQPSIRKYCPGDCGKRFSSVDTTKVWLTKGRLVFLLKDTSGEIAGYGWVGPSLSKQVPDATLTGGIRINELYQGRGLATPYLSVMLAYIKKHYPDQILWFSAWESNLGAVHVYKKLGFQTITSEKDTRPSIDNNAVNDVRLFMRLA